ncbi:tyrosine-type recombinase/integrase [Paracoccus aminovorans]|uniref:tyrosine-type recombinase/integrase n=1 Tax=Paracoccus aminovorans TaxID=34004 RepID=UPI0012E353CB|nr:hypothetical protein [Paracoccus aminovorans]
MFPTLGDRVASTIAPKDVVAVVRKIEGRGSVAAARRIRGKVSQIFRFGVAEGILTHDPARDIDEALAPRSRQKRLSWLSAEELPALLVRVRAEAPPEVGLAILLAADTIHRTRPVLRAEWAEIEELDGLESMWRTPADKMKVKAWAKGMRCHTSLLAAIDSELEVSRPDGGRVVSLRVGKQRDARSDYDLANAELVRVRIGTDEEGDAIESAVMAWGIGKPAEPVKLTRPQEIAMQVFNTLGNGEPVNREKLISACVAAGVSGAKDEKSRRRGVKGALNELTDKEVLTCENGMYRTFHPDDRLGFEDLGELSDGENGGKSPIFPTPADIGEGGKRGKRPIGLSPFPHDAPSIFAMR